VRIYLVQHGEALSKEVDAQRPLSQRGQADVTAMAGMLAASNVSVTDLRHSGKLRARQTADLLGARVAPGLETTATTGLQPKDPVASWLGRIAGVGDDLMLVGHLPFVGRLAGLLIAGDEDSSIIAFRPGSVLCLESDGGLRWAVAWMLRPELLPGS
jgi:phosphohistidine phosphatase